MITPKGLEYGEMSHVIVIWSKYWSICQNLKDKGKKKNQTTTKNPNTFLQKQTNMETAIVSLNSFFQHS